jgi:putative methyltransferase (TIGR04325 family)
MPNMKVDIIHSASTIEYIEDDEGLLEILAKKYSPQYFFLTRIKGGNMPDFITKQTVRGYSTPCRFSSVPRLINFFEKIGYRVILNSPCGSFVSDNFNHDIPLELQIRRGVDLILEKN